MSLNKNSEIEKLGLSSRAYNGLCRRGLKTVGDILRMPSKELRKIRGIGDNTFNEILQKMETAGVPYVEPEKSQMSKRPALPQDAEAGTRIEKLGLSSRAYNCLCRSRLWTVEAILETPSEEIRKIHNLGPGTYEEIMQKMAAAGMPYVEPENPQKPNKEATGLDAGIESLHLSTRLVTALNKHKVYTIADLLDKSYLEIQEIEGVGMGYFNEIMEKLNDAGIKFEDRKIEENSRLEELRLSSAPYLALRRIGVKTVGDLVNLPLEEFNHLRNVGVKELDEIFEKLKGAGFDYVTYTRETPAPKPRVKIFDSLKEKGLDAIKDLPDSYFEKGSKLYNEVTIAVEKYLNETAEELADLASEEKDLDEIEKHLAEQRTQVQTIVQEKRGETDFESKKSATLSRMKRDNGDVRRYHHDPNLGTQPEQRHQHNPFFDEGRKL